LVIAGTARSSASSDRPVFGNFTGGIDDSVPLVFLFLVFRTELTRIDFEEQKCHASLERCWFYSYLPLLDVEEPTIPTDRLCIPSKGP
jgi:hypothetical protein